MSKAGGCFKIGCVGIVLFMIASSLGTWTFFRSIDNADDSDFGDLGEFTANADGATPSGSFQTGSDPVRAVGRIDIQVGQGGLFIVPGDPGSKTRIESDANPDHYNFSDTTEEGSSGWVRTIKFGREGGLFKALFNGGATRDDDADITVFISPDEPIELTVTAKQAGFEADLSGLWITRAKLVAKTAGGELTLEDPMKQPMDHLMVVANLGGFELTGLANASPARLDVRCSVGGAELDLSGGDWMQDSDINVDVTMGGLEIVLPHNVKTVGISGSNSSRLRETEEFPDSPTLDFDINTKMGGVEISDR